MHFNLLHWLMTASVLIAVLLALSGCAYHATAPRWNWYQRAGQVEDNASQLLRKDCAGLNQATNEDFAKLEND